VNTLISYTKAVLVVLLMGLVAVGMFSMPVLAQQVGTQSTISSAKTALEKSCEAVKQAEAAGANVDGLMVTLNAAAGLLSKAELAYGSGNYNAASTYANQCISQLNGFVSQADAAKQAAVSSDRSFLTIILSFGASAAIVAAGVGSWVVLDRRERKRSNGV
jgi:hypothetical protein